VDNREIDKLVAEKVMGWKVIEGKGIMKPIGRTFWRLVDDFYPTINMESAWLVVERICEAKRWRVIMDVNETYTEVTFKTQMGSWIQAHSEEETAPLAICKAALKAVGVEV